MQRECILVTSVRSCCCHLVILIASHIFVLCRTKYCLLDCLLFSPCKGDVSLFFFFTFLFLWHNSDSVICVLVLLLLRSHCRFVSCLWLFASALLWLSSLNNLLWSQDPLLTAPILHFMHLFKTLIYESLYTPTPLWLLCALTCLCWNCLLVKKKNTKRYEKADIFIVIFEESY